MYFRTAARSARAQCGRLLTTIFHVQTTSAYVDGYAFIHVHMYTLIGFNRGMFYMYIGVVVVPIYIDMREWICLECYS